MAHLVHVSSLSGQARTCVRSVMRDDRWKERPRCPGFLLPFGHRHWLVGPSRSRRGARPSLRSAYRAVPGPRRGCHVPHGRDPTGEGALCTPGRRCSHDRLLVTGRRCRSPAASPAPSTTSHLRGFRCRGINESSLALTRPVFSLPVAPGWSGNPWAYPLVLRTPPLPATHARGGDGSRTLFRSSLLPTSSTLQSASPLKPCDLVSQRGSQTLAHLRQAVRPVFSRASAASRAR